MANADSRHFITAHAHYIRHVESGHFISRSVRRELLFMPPSHTLKDTTNQTIVWYTTTLSAPNQQATIHSHGHDIVHVQICLTKHACNTALLPTLLTYAASLC